MVLTAEAASTEQAGLQPPWPPRSRSGTAAKGSTKWGRGGGGTVNSGGLANLRLLVVSPTSFSFKFGDRSDDANDMAAASTLEQPLSPN